MTYQNNYVLESRQLRNKGQQLSQLHQLYKALGLAVTGVSGLAVLSSGGALLPLVMGLLAYGGSVVSENQRTKKLKPLPWVSSDLSAVASGALQDTSRAALGTQAHHYLSPEDKALFYLTNFQGHRLTELSAQMDIDQFEHILVNLVDHLVTAHEPALNHPELLGKALQTDFFESAISNLPRAASKAVGEKTKLSAIEAKALPVSKAATASTVDSLPIREDWDQVFDRIVDQAEFPSVFIFGRQGTGKTTTVNYLLSRISNKKVVLDPHYKYGAWKGCEVVGKGMNYQEIDEFITDCLEDIQSRYLLFATTPNYRPDVVTVVCEELTNWAEHISKGKAFTKASLSDFRKAGYQSISVAHGDTNTARGGASGTRKMRDEGEVHIKLLAKGKARITFPDEEPFILYYPNLEAYTVVQDDSFTEHDGPIKASSATEQEAVELLGRIAAEIKRQASEKAGGSITVRAAAQFLSGDSRREIYPQMPQLCQALAEMYPDDFEVFQGVADEWRVAYLKSPTYRS